PFPMDNLFEPCSLNRGLRFIGGGFAYTEQPGVGTILGATLLEGMVIFFDRGSSPARVGFAPGVKCLTSDSANMTADEIDVLAGPECWEGSGAGLRPPWGATAWPLHLALLLALSLVL